MARTKKPKVEIKRTRTSLGWAYRIYIDGHYMATGLTAASARKVVPRMVTTYERTFSRKAT
jgi:hypothetical protein